MNMCNGRPTKYTFGRWSTKVKREVLVLSTLHKVVSKLDYTTALSADVPSELRKGPTVHTVGYIMLLSITCFI